MGSPQGRIDTTKPVAMPKPRPRTYPSVISISVCSRCHQSKPLATMRKSARMTLTGSLKNSRSISVPESSHQANSTADNKAACSKRTCHFSARARTAAPAASAAHSERSRSRGEASGLKATSGGIVGPGFQDLLAQIIPDGVVYFGESRRLVNVEHVAWTRQRDLADVLDSARRARKDCDTV